MPVEKVFDISLKLTDEDLGKLDKLASKAQKKLQKRGGIFAKVSEEVEKQEVKIPTGGKAPLEEKILTGEKIPAEKKNSAKGIR